MVVARTYPHARPEEHVDGELHEQQDRDQHDPDLPHDQVVVVGGYRRYAVAALNLNGGVVQVRYLWKESFFRANFFNLYSSAYMA